MSEKLETTKSELEIRQALAELALRGGQMTLDEIEVEVEIKDE